MNTLQKGVQSGGMVPASGSHWLAEDFGLDVSSLSPELAAKALGKRTAAIFLEEVVMICPWTELTCGIHGTFCRPPTQGREGSCGRALLGGSNQGQIRWCSSRWVNGRIGMGLCPGVGMVDR